VTATVHLPPGPRWSVPLQGLAYLASRQRMMQALSKRYGSEFTVRLPLFGPTVVISDPALVKRLHNRGVAFAPRQGGRAVVYRRIRSATQGRTKTLQPATSR
jgi:hypothetical protein